MLRKSDGSAMRRKRIQALACEASPDAIKTLVQIATDQGASPSARVQAACAILDRAWGKPPQAIAVSTEHRNVQELSDAELMAIVASGDDEDEIVEEPATNGSQH